MKNLVAGGAGFLGSHIIDSLMMSGEDVICLDNLTSGNINNLNRWSNNPKFVFMEHDILSSFMLASSIMDTDVIVSYGDVIFDENILQPLIDFKDGIGLAIDFDWEKNYEKIDKKLKLEATVSLVKNEKCIRIVDGRELQKSNNQTIDEIFNSKNEKVGEFVGLMKLSKQGGKTFCDVYETLSKTHSGKFHEANSLSEAYFTDMIQELIDSKNEVIPISVKGKWCEIDTMEDLKRAEELF